MMARAAMVAGLAALLAALVAAFALSGGGADGPVHRKPIADVLAEHADRLLALPGVAGVAEAECGRSPCIVVLVVRRTPELARQIPDRLEGYRVELRETGEIEARDDD